MTPFPAGWALVKLGEVAETRLGKMLSAKARSGVGSRPYLRNKNVQWARFDLSDVRQMDFATDEFERFEVAAGDLLVCEGGEVGRAAIWRGQIEGVAYQKALHRIRPHPGLAPEFLLYVLMWFSRHNALDRFVTGSTIKHLPQEALREIPIPLPPLDEQHRIVAMLEQQFSRLDAADRLLKTVVERLRALRRAALSIAVADGEQGRVGDLLQRIEAGRSFRCHVRPAAENEWGVIRVSAMTWGSFDERENKAVVSAETVDPRWEIKSGDLLLSRANTSEYVGASVLVDRCRSRLLLSDKSMRLIPSHNAADSRWLRFALSAPESRAQMSAVASGTSDSMRNISQAKVAAVTLRVPPLPAQLRIVEEIEARLTLIDALASTVRLAQSRSTRLRRSILDAAYAGSLAPRDAMPATI